MQSRAWGPGAGGRGTADKHAVTWLESAAVSNISCVSQGVLDRCCCWEMVHGKVGTGAVLRMCARAGPSLARECLFPHVRIRRMYGLPSL